MMASRRAQLAPTGVAAVLLVGIGVGCASGGRGDWPVSAEVHPAEPVPPPSTRPSPALRVASYNLARQRDPNRALPADLRAVAADVWLLQEVRLPRAKGPSGSTATSGELRALFDDPGWHFAVARVNPIDSRAASDVEAQVIASRLPILRAEAWPLASASTRRRVALAAWLDVGGSELLVVNTDHEPGFLSLAATQDGHRRDLVAHLEHYRGTPTIVGGDFNTVGNVWRLRTSRADARAARRALAQAGFAAAVALPAATFSAGIVDGWLDHLFASGVRVDGGGVASAARTSDHRPIWISVTPGLTVRQGAAR